MDDIFQILGMQYRKWAHGVVLPTYYLIEWAAEIRRPTERTRGSNLNFGLCKLALAISILFNLLCSYIAFYIKSDKLRNFHHA